MKHAEKRRLGIGLIVAAVVLLAFLTILLVREKHQEKEAGDSSVYGTLLSEYYDAVFSENGEAMQKLIAPEAYWTYVQEQYNETKEDEIAAYSKPGRILERAVWLQCTGYIFCQQPGAAVRCRSCRVKYVSERNWMRGRTGCGTDRYAKAQRKCRRGRNHDSADHDSGGRKLVSD